MTRHSLNFVKYSLDTQSPIDFLISLACVTSACRWLVGTCSCGLMYRTLILRPLRQLVVLLSPASSQLPSLRHAATDLISTSNFNSNSNQHSYEPSTVNL